MMMRVEIKYENGSWAQDHKIENEGDIEKAVSTTIRSFRENNNGVSLYDAEIKLYRPPQ